MIRKICENIWIKDSHFKALGCKGSTRMTIVKSAQGLLIHSPVAINNAERDEINALGDVAHIVAPNLFHHMHFTDCAQMFPHATCWAPEGLAHKISNLPAHKILDATKPIIDNGELLQLEMNGHKINETLFFHAASATLITADFIYNYRAEQNTVEKLLFKLLNCYDKITVPFYHALSIADKSSFSSSLNAIYNLPVKRIIMSHGRIIESPDAALAFKSAWAKISKRLNKAKNHH